MIRTHTATVTLVGAETTGSAQTPRPVFGRLMAIYVDYTGMPAGTDVTIKTKHAPIQTILTLTDNITDGWFYPRALLDSAAGADLAGVYDAMPIDDYLEVSVAQGDAGSVTAYFLVEC